MKTAPRTDADTSLRRNLVVALLTTVFLVVAVGGWASSTELMGAVIAPGQLVVESNVKKVQHLTGGVVGELNVRDGDRVRAGDVVVRLDDTQTRANLGIIVKSLNELSAREARAEAERDGKTSVTFPDELLASRDTPEISRLVDGEQRLFENRVKAREGQKAQLHQQIDQSGERIIGLNAQVEAKTQEIEWNRQELVGIRELWTKKLVPFTRVTTVERDGARLVGERGQLIAAIAETKGRISEIELKIIQVDQDMRTELGKDIAEIRGKRSELTEKRVSAEDALKRIDIRAPIDGTVYQSTIHTVGGVVAAGEALMIIVPAADALLVESRIMPQEVDQVRVGQHAMLRLVAFNQRTTPELNGRVVKLSPDVTLDQKTGANYYTVRIAISESEVSRLGEVRLIPGMPVESFIQTDARTVMSYLMRPMQEQINRAFRER